MTAAIPPVRRPTSASFGRIKVRLPYAAPGQAIGLLGGSFNPPHLAHLMISETAIKRAGLDKVWWIVSPGNPLKKRSETAPLAERMALCRSVARNPRIIVTDFERDLPTPYTASTLAFLRARNPLVRFVWVMGADNLATINRWQSWRDIFAIMPIVVVDRPGWRMKALASKAARMFASARVSENEARHLPFTATPAWTFLTAPLSSISSTEIREKTHSGGADVAERAQSAGVPSAKSPQPRAMRSCASGQGS
jgi:nicotinate-nucleotide adenylyltransferase